MDMETHQRDEDPHVLFLQRKKRATRNVIGSRLSSCRLAQRVFLFLPNYRFLVSSQLPFFSFLCHTQDPWMAVTQEGDNLLRNARLCARLGEGGPKVDLTRNSRSSSGLQLHMETASSLPRRFKFDTYPNVPKPLSRSVSEKNIWRENQRYQSEVLKLIF